MIGLAIDGVEWLLHHPVALCVAIVLAGGALSVWWVRPITWRDGEGPLLNRESDMSVGSWVLQRLMRALFWW